MADANINTTIEKLHRSTLTLPIKPRLSKCFLNRATKSPSATGQALNRRTKSAFPSHATCTHVRATNDKKNKNADLTRKPIDRAISQSQKTRNYKIVGTTPRRNYYGG